tara:strand:- start:490 stop:2115 length:1626 start_codon:yes stop_codon:yes gene_type:complete
MGLTKKQLNDVQEAVDYFSKIGKKEGWLKQKDIDKAKQAIKVMKGGRRKSKKSRKSRSRRGGAGLGEECMWNQNCDGDLICNDENKCDRAGVDGTPLSLGEVATMLQTASNDANYDRNVQIASGDLPNKGGRNPYANQKGADIVNTTTTMVQQFVSSSAGLTDADLLKMALLSGKPNMVKLILDREERKEDRAERIDKRKEDRAERMEKARRGDMVKVYKDAAKKNKEVELDRNKTQLLLYNSSQYEKHTLTQFHMNMQFITFAIFAASGIAAANTGEGLVELFRKIDDRIGGGMQLNIPYIDIAGESWWSKWIPQLINLFIAVLNGAAGLTDMFVGAFTQTLVALAELGPLGMFSGVMLIGILFMMAEYLLMRTRRVSGFLAIGGLTVNIGDPTDGQAIPQVGSTPSLFADMPGRIGRVINSGADAPWLSRAEERLLLPPPREPLPFQGRMPEAPPQEPLPSQGRMPTPPPRQPLPFQGRMPTPPPREEEVKRENKEDDNATMGGRRRTRRRRRKKRKTKRKKRRRRSKSKRRRRRKSRR